MRCSASPTTSIAADVAVDRNPTVLVDAVLFRALLAPLAAGLGPVAGTALEATLDRLAAQRVR